MITEVLVNLGCTQFASWLKESLPKVHSLKNITVLAPSNQAIEAFACKEMTPKVLLAHFFDPAVFSDEMVDGIQMRSFNGQLVTFHLWNSRVFVSTRTTTAKVVLADEEASVDTVIHVIDAVLLPDNETVKNPWDLSRYKLY